MFLPGVVVRVHVLKLPTASDCELRLTPMQANAINGTPLYCLISTSRHPIGVQLHSRKMKDLVMIEAYRNAVGSAFHKPNVPHWESKKP